MTSQKFSANKQSAKYDLKASFKRNAAPAALTLVFSVFVFLFKPLMRLFSFYNRKTGFDLESLRDNYSSLLVTEEFNATLMIGFFALALGALFAFTAFRFMSSKPQVNVYFSSGVDRRTIFKNRVVSSVVLFAAAEFIPIFINTIINIIFFSHTDFMLYHAFLCFAEVFVYTLTGFAIMSVAMLSCNTILEKLVFGAGLAGLPTLLTWAASAFCEFFLRGYPLRSIMSVLTYYGGSNYTYMKPSLLHYASFLNPLIFGKRMSAGAAMNDNIFKSAFRYNEIRISEYANEVIGGADGPAAVYSNGGWDTGYGEISSIDSGYKFAGGEYIIPIIIWAVISVVLILAARALIIRFKAENAGIYGRARVPAVIISAEIALGAALIGGYIANSSGNKFVWLVPVAALFITYFIILSIARKKIKHNIKSLVVPLDMSVIAIIICLVLGSGGFGYSEYAPKIEEIDRAYIATKTVDASGSETENGLGWEQPSVFQYANDSRYLGIFTDKEDLEKFVKVAKRVSDRTDSEPAGEVGVVYELKNGERVTRRFKVTDKTAYDNIASLTDTKAYRDELTYLMTGDALKKSDFIKAVEKAEEVTEYSFFKFNGRESAALSAYQYGDVKLLAGDGITMSKIENTDELREAVLADRLAMSFAERRRNEERPLGAVIFEPRYQDGDEWHDKAAAEQNKDGKYYSTYSDSISVYIYPSMTNTINYLKSSKSYELLNKELEREIVSAKVVKISDYAKASYRVDMWTFTSDRFNTVYALTDKEIGYSLDDEYFKKFKETTDSDKISALEKLSRIYMGVESDDYLVLYTDSKGNNSVEVIPAKYSPLAESLR